MNILTKSVLGAGAAAAALVSMAAPAQARGYERDSISAGDVIAGAIIIGGLAAVLSGDRDNRDRRYEGDYRRGDDNNYRGDRYDNRGYDNGYSNNGNGRDAVNQCVQAAERWGSRYSRVKVTEVRDIDRTRYGYKVTGNLVLRDGWRGQGNGYGRNYGSDGYGRNDNYDRGGHDRYGDNRGYNRGYDKGRFACYVEYGRVVDVKYSGLDQWR